MPTARIIQTYTIAFRGVPEEWSLGFNFQMGSNPTDAPTLKEISDDVWTRVVKPTLSDTCKFIRVTGGPLGSDAIFAEKRSGTEGGSHASQAQHPEVCVMMSSQLGPGRFARKWIHTGWAQQITANDEHVQTADKTLINNAYVHLTDGTLPHGVRYCFPNGDLAVAPFLADTWLRTRQFRRRGKRPSPSSG